MNTTRIRALGLMCGTSHDGIDAALVDFEISQQGVSHEVRKVIEHSLPRDLRTSMSIMTGMDALSLQTLDRDFCLHLAKEVQLHFASELTSIDVIGLHGPTVFHQPEKRITTQLGSGAILSALLEATVACDFRQQDVSKGGQGAPLIPFADQLLHNSFDFTLNLGGFCNLSDLRKGRCLGFDIGVCNLLLNHLCNLHDMAFDEGGRLASTGNVIALWLERLNALPYYELLPPKSLGYEWFKAAVIPTIPSDHPLPDLLRTACEHIAQQIARNIPASTHVLVTGGGAWNDFLLSRILELSKADVHRPEASLVNHRESIAFALFGALRYMGSTNVLASVTGARSNTVAGALYIG